ncbi:hypothetical protein ACJX0J_008929, partial [Zea mays]
MKYQLEDTKIFVALDMMNVFFLDSPLQGNLIEQREAIEDQEDEVILPSSVLKMTNLAQVIAQEKLVKDNIFLLKAIRILLAYACAHDIKIYQMDFKSAFLNGYMNELKPNHVYKLQINQIKNNTFDTLRNDNMVDKKVYRLDVLENKFNLCVEAFNELYAS